MTSTRTPHPSAARRFRWFALITVGLFLGALVAAGAARAEPTPPSTPGGNQPVPPPAGSSVEALQDILKGEGGPDLDARKKRIDQLINEMDLSQLSRVLLLQEWHTLESGVPRTDAERKRMQGDSDARTLAAQRFRDKAKEALQAARQAPKGAATEQRKAAMLARAATADLIGETAAAGRKLDYLSQLSGGTTPGKPNQGPARVGYLAQQLSGLTPDLIALAKMNDPSVPEASALAQKAAARALGEIQPLDPAEVVGALGELLADHNNSPDLRLAAAESMDHLAQAAAEEMQRSLGLDENVQNRFLDFAQAIWSAVLRQGLAPGQPAEVRRASLLAFRRIAAEMLDISVIPETNGGQLRETDPAIAKLVEDRLNSYFQRLVQVFAEYQKNAAPLAEAARDPDQETRLTALSILSDLANVRQRLYNLKTGAVGVPAPDTGPPGPPASDGKTIKPQTSRPPAGIVILAAAEEPAKEPAKAPAKEPAKESPRDKAQDDLFNSVAAGLDATLGALRRDLTAPDPQTRRAAVDVLELLGPAAFPAADSLTNALRDPDMFVRWATARTLGNLVRMESDKQKLTKAQTDAAVLGTAELLRDQDVGARVAAATALEKYGPRAGPAAAILTRSINHSQTEPALQIVPTPDTEPDLIKGDPSVRIAAFRALEAINGDEAIRALPEAVTALRDGNVLVQQAAADMIGRVGPKAAEAERGELIRQLGAAMADPDGDVRRAVSGALLRLIPQKTK